MTTRISRLAGALLVGGLTLGIAAPAFAEDTGAEENGDDSARHRPCEAAIERRLNDLANVQIRLDGVDALTDAHEATIDGIIDSTESGLTQLAVDIDEAEGPADKLALCLTIAPDYRVYLVVMPQSHLTVASDRVDKALAVGDEIVARFDAAVDAAIAAGADVDDAVELRDAAVAHLDAAEVANSGVADSVLAVTPAGYNDGSGAATLESAREDLRGAHEQIGEGMDDGRAAIEALRDALEDLGEDD